MQISIYIDTDSCADDPFIQNGLAALAATPHGAIAQADGVYFHRDAEGEYIETSRLMDTPPSRVAHLPTRKVVVFDQGTALRPRIGIYNQGEAQAVVELYEERTTTFWRLRVMAPTWDAAVGLYRMIREGSISPDEIWRDGGKVSWLTRLCLWAKHTSKQPVSI